MAGQIASKVQRVHEVGVWAHSTIPDAAPGWARCLTSIGHEMAERPNQKLGERSSVLFVSVPTGQYAAWLMAAGALGALPKLELLDEPGDYRCTTWVEELQQVADANVKAVSSSSGNSAQLNLQVQPDDLPRRGRHDSKRKPVVTTYPQSKLPIVRHMEGTPNERKGQLNLHIEEKEAIREAITPLLPLDVPWYLWWTRQCLSPVVMVGTGSDFLMRQRAEILDESPSWMWPTSQTTLALNMKRLCDPSRVLFFPFSVISPTVGGRFPWLRSLRPRLVIYTSWSAFAARHPAAFAGVPAIVLVNRRVESSLKCADATEQIRHNTLASVRSNVMKVRGIDLRLVDYSVVQDDGLIADIDDEEETPDEF